MASIAEMKVIVIRNWKTRRTATIRSNGNDMTWHTREVDANCCVQYASSVHDGERMEGSGNDTLRTTSSRAEERKGQLSRPHVRRSTSRRRNSHFLRSFLLTSHNTTTRLSLARFCHVRIGKYPRHPSYPGYDMCRPSPRRYWELFHLLQGLVYYLWSLSFPASENR